MWNLGVLAAAAGTTEVALRLLLAVFAGVPLSLVYNAFVAGRNATLQHLFFFLSGFGLVFFCYGEPAAAMIEPRLSG